MALRNALFATVTLLIPIAFAALCVMAYFLFGYLLFRGVYCSSFAELDDEIGWIPAPRAESCIRGYASLFGRELFASEVRINANGFRAQGIDSPTPTGGLLAIGDSWTFGYGIAWAETFAARLERDHGRPTALLASPAYSGAQAVLLARRHLKSVRPRAIIYLELGYWNRAVCSGSTRPAKNLKPCYWVDPAGRGELVVPEPGRVARAARCGLLPGGMVGAGESTLTYFLIARPVAKAEQALVRLGLLSGFGDDFSGWGRAEDLREIRRVHFEALSQLASEARARLVLIDPDEIYREFLPHAPGLDLPRGPLIYVGEGEWSEHVTTPSARLAPDDARVPGDGHYGPGTHKLIAALVDRKLDEVE